jgi:3-hydroxyacyl-[acyl-carrier-protein] dehydratase
MPSQPFLDLGALDLTRIVHTKEELYEQLSHRGTFAVVDGILHLDARTGVIVGFKDIRADDWWAKDHVPGRPIFPGALMIEASAHLGCFVFYRMHAEARDKFAGFAAIDKTRFRAPVEPPSRLIFVGRAVRTRARLFTYAYQGFVDGQIVFESEITGMVL